ncbi:hypothetical protein GCM10028819_10060 [Spirosoma humi]
MINKIVVIEDVDQIRNSIVEILTLNGYRVGATSNGMDGIKLIERWRPNLVLCDIMMPQLDGYQVLEAIRKSPDQAHIPFIFITAKTDVVDIRRGMYLGADDYLPKPFLARDLLNAIASRLRRSQQQSQTSINSDSDFLLTIQGQDQRGNRILQIQDCLYFFTQQRSYFVAHSLGTFQIKKTIDKLAAELDPNQFFRINRQLIIHRRMVKSYAYWEKGKYCLVLAHPTISQAILPKARFDAFKRWLQG